MLQMPVTCPKCYHSFPAGRQTCCHQPQGPSIPLLDGVAASSGGADNQCIWRANGANASGVTRYTVTISTPGPQTGFQSNVRLCCDSGGTLFQASVDSSPRVKEEDSRQLILGLDVRPSLDIPDSQQPTVPSPSLPFSFTIPDTAPQQQEDYLKRLMHMGTCISTKEDYPGDLERLNKTKAALTMSGFYYEGLSWQEAARMLKSTPVGTFLVRDSSDPRFLYSLSVHTERGPTSVRIHYHRGRFRLDAEERIAHLMPLFDSVVGLVEHYVQNGATNRKLVKGQGQQGQVWVDGSGKMYSPIRLDRPLRRTVQSLQHLCTLTIHQVIRGQEHLAKLPLPDAIATYLTSYPYRI